MNLKLESRASLEIDGVNFNYATAFFWEDGNTLIVESVLPSSGAWLDMFLDTHRGAIQAGTSIRLEFGFKIDDVTVDCICETGDLTATLRLTVFDKQRVAPR